MTYIPFMAIARKADTTPLFMVPAGEEMATVNMKGRNLVKLGQSNRAWRSSIWKMVRESGPIETYELAAPSALVSSIVPSLVAINHKACLPLSRLPARRGK